MIVKTAFRFSIDKINVESQEDEKYTLPSKGIKGTRFSSGLFIQKDSNYGLEISIQQAITDHLALEGDYNVYRVSALFGPRQANNRISLGVRYLF